MGITVSGKTFTPAPAGLHQAVCCDVFDLGQVDVTYNGKTRSQHKVVIYWQSAERMADGRPFLLHRRYTASLDAKASLRKDLESWRGRPFTEAELKGFDLEVLIGINCQLNVQHAERNGDVFANVAAVVPLGKGMPKISVTPDFVRKIHRQDENGHTANGDAAPELDDSDIPFSWVMPLVAPLTGLIAAGSLLC